VTLNQIPHIVVTLVLALQVHGIVLHQIQSNVPLQNQFAVILQTVLIVLRNYQLVSPLKPMLTLKSSLKQTMKSLQTLALPVKSSVALIVLAVLVLVLIQVHSVLKKRAHQHSQLCVLMVVVR